SDGIDGEIAAPQVLLQCHRRVGADIEAVVARAGFQFGTGERVLLVALRMQVDRKTAADAPVTLRFELSWCCTDDDPVALADRQAQQPVAYGTAYQEDLHGPDPAAPPISGRPCDDRYRSGCA